MLVLSWNVAGWSSTSAAIRESYGTLQSFFDATGASIICIQECKGTLAKLQSSSFDMGGSDALPAKRKTVSPLNLSPGAGASSPPPSSSRGGRAGGGDPASASEYTVGAIHGWESFWSFSGKQHRGFNGVVTFAKKGLTWRCDSQPFGECELNDEGRVVVTHHSAFVVVNVYVPNARGGKRAAFKTRFLRALRDVLDTLRAQTGKPVVLCGDLNMTYRAQDACWSLRRLRLADIVELHRDSRQLDDGAWQQKYPCLTKASLSYAYNVISNHLCARVAVLSESSSSDGTAAAAVGPTGATTEKEEESKGSPSVSVDSWLLAEEEAVQADKIKNLKETVLQFLRSGEKNTSSLTTAATALLFNGAAPPVPLEDWYAGGLRCVHMSDLTKSYPPQHNRDLFSVAQYAGLAPHGDESVLFMSALLWKAPRTALTDAAADEYTRANRCAVRMWDSFLLKKDPDTGAVESEAVNEAYCPCAYTCWDQSHNCRLSNEGTRIDYILLDESLAKCLVPRAATENNCGFDLDIPKSALAVGGGEPASVQETFFSEFTGGAAQRDGARRAMADGSYPPAPYDGSGMPEVSCRARTFCLRGLPSTGLFVTPPQWSDHIGVAVQLTCTLTPRPGKMVEDHPNCMHRPPVGLQTFFAKAKKETEKLPRGEGDREKTVADDTIGDAKVSRRDRGDAEIVNVDSD